ncbi:FecR family protein [Pedobacter sp. L105]|uniref:FecR family protein n=1 Tax=Pedobacter sp. L105 TaxID=1641871 RepID=UPI00131ACC85|nr:FecR family protein [Pedobacter sp. L105]
MDTEQIKDLIQKQQTGQLTDEEQAILDTWYLKLSQIETVKVNETDITNRLNAIWIGLDVNKKKLQKNYTLWPRIAVAASVLLMLSAGGYFLMHKLVTPQLTVQNQIHEIAPGSNKATLTLANGQQIVLTKNMAGKLAVQGQTQIQINNGAITYAGANDPIIAYNTLTTKRKEQFPLILADGTEVTLDAASSITYPVAFNGKERKVKITGQAYFKVVHNDRQPFVVQVKGQTIRDIGTEFNINAYDDEPIVRTTLVQGSIAIVFNDQTNILKPGQEADLINNALMIKSGNIDEATAWKNNLFHFTGVDLKTVMRQFSRWYDVDVSYQGEIPDYEFAGEMSRNVKASEVFDALSRYGLKFKIDGKNIIVSKSSEK